MAVSVAVVVVVSLVVVAPGAPLTKRAVDAGVTSGESARLASASG
ncbi:hypothetical protein [Streptomyces hebeiensis]